MTFLLGLAGILILSDAAGELDKHPAPSTWVWLGVGALLLIAALVDYLIGAHDDE